MVAYYYKCVMAEFKRFPHMVLGSMVDISAWSNITYSKYRVETNQLEAIVFYPTITVKSSPGQAGKDLFVIHEGTKVYILDEHNDWCNIRIANGSAGWLPAGSIKRI